MAEEIIRILWSESAKDSFQKIISYLQKEWSEKEIANFVQRTDKMLSTLQRYPEMCRPSIKRKNVRIVFWISIHKLFTIINREKPKLKFFYFGA